MQSARDHTNAMSGLLTCATRDSKLAAVAAFGGGVDPASASQAAVAGMLLDHGVPGRNAAGPHCSGLVLNGVGQPGSMPFDLITASAAGAARNLMNALATSASLLATDTAAEK